MSFFYLRNFWYFVLIIIYLAHSTTRVMSFYFSCNHCWAEDTAGPARVPGDEHVWQAVDVPLQPAGGPLSRPSPCHQAERPFHHVKHYWLIDGDYEVFIAGVFNQFFYLLWQMPCGFDLNLSEPVCGSVVDPNTLNLDPNPEFWPNLDPDPGPDPWLWYQLWK